MRHGIVDYTFLLTAGLLLAGDSNAGSLEPPGPPGPTMKTLDQVQPRIPIGSLPFAISQPGSYYLTRDLTGVSGQSGITITANWVTLDLNGFSLIGVGGSLDGVRTPLAQRQIVVRNGVIRSWGGMGISASNTTHVQAEDLRLDANGSAGLSVGSGSTVRDTTATFNGGSGIFVGTASVIAGCTSGNNSGPGMTLSSGSRIVRSMATLSNIGIFGGDGVSIEECTVFNNVDDGIRVGTRGLVRGNIAVNNLQDGIEATGNENRIEDNESTQNFNGSGFRVLGVNNLIVRNSASLNIGEYSIAAGNKLGPISADPATAGLWANFDL